jgi:micrococcal nuclease
LGAHAESVGYVYDGDTVKIVDGMLEYKLRISDIDAPERNQTYGKKSRRALIKLCLGANIHEVSTGVDRYQRRLGKLSCNNQDASLFMVKNGHAWFYDRYSNDGTLALAEQDARKNKLGLWANPTPTAPWVWRKKHPHTFAK